MGHRANLVYATDKGFDFYRDSWIAYRLDKEIFWHPDFVESIILSRGQPQNGIQYDEIWAEGGLIFNTPQKELLWYGGDEVITHIPLRRHYMKLMHYAWEGWTLRWAYNRLREIADYTGQLFDNLSSKPYPFGGNFQLYMLSADELLNQYDPAGVISVHHLDDTIRFAPPVYLEPFDSLDCLRSPMQQVLTEVQQKATLPELKITNEQVNNNSIGCAIHFDMIEHKIYTWSSVAPLALHYKHQEWEDWKIIWLEDRYEDHIALTDGRLHLPTYTDDELTAQLRDALIWDMPNYHTGRAFYADRIMLEQAGLGTLDNTGKMNDTQFDYVLNYKTQRFDEIVTKWRADQKS